MRVTSIFGLVVFLTLTPVFGQVRPVTNFFVLPDDVPGVGSSSMGLGSVGGTAVALDFTALQTEGRGGFLTLAFQPATPTVHQVLDLNWAARDPASGAELSFVLDSSGAGGTVTSTASFGFPNGAVMNLGIPVTIASSGLSGVPASGVLTLSGTVVPGFHHRVCLLTGGVSTLPGLSLSLFIKEDAFVPGISWHYVTKSGASSVTPGGASAESLHGRLAITRDPLLIDHFQLSELDMTSATHSVQLASPTALILDAATRSFTGSLELLVDGSPVTVPVDGVGDLFSGEAPRPESLRIEANGIPGLDALLIETRRAELVPGGSSAGPGLAYAPLFRGPPGYSYLAAAAFDPAPGLNTPLGDVPLDFDSLLVYSTSPNPIFFNMSGAFSSAGEANLLIAIPNDPLLSGLQFFLGGIVIDPVGVVVAVTQPHRVEL